MPKFSFRHPEINDGAWFLITDHVEPIAPVDAAHQAINFIASFQLNQNKIGKIGPIEIEIREEETGNVSHFEVHCEKIWHSQVKALKSPIQRLTELQRRQEMERETIQ